MSFLPARDAKTLSTEEIIAALDHSGGIKKKAAVYLGVPYLDFMRRVKRDSKISPTITELKESLVDEAEAVIADALKDEDPKVRLQAAKYTTANLGASRGWKAKAMDANAMKKYLILFQETVESMVQKFVLPGKQMSAKKFFAQKMREGISKHRLG